jgi:ectoine hydroxylase-related dioxygenase (phytanoyl-CoA dioxygenase family)
VSTEDILGVYGKAQATFAGQTSALDAVPLVRAVDVLDHFALLIADDNPDAVTSIFRYFEPEDLDNLRRNLDAHGRVLRDIAQRVDAFEPTINHCDMIPSNALRREDGTPCIFDWDDAIRSAPGWSLTPSFTGCVRVYAALRETSLYRDSAERDKDRKRMAIYLEGLTQNNAYALRDLLEIVPAAAIFGALREATTLTPYDLSTGSSGEGRAKSIAKVFSQRIPQVFRAALLISSAEQRGRPLPPRALPVVDMADPSVDPAEVAKQFRAAGAIHLKGCFTPELVQEAAAEFAASQDRHQQEISDGAALRVGDRRHMVTLDTDGVFGRPEMLASERLMAIFDHLLGRRFILGSATAVVSHPGGRPQRWHRDNFALFEEDKKMSFPPILISVIVPLVPINNIVGSTQIAIGSSQDRDLDETICPLVEPQTELGDCYLMDSALIHRGMPNQSDNPRPIVALVYQRPWYVDVENFGRQDRIRMSKPIVDGLPETRQHLVQWALPR